MGRRREPLDHRQAHRLSDEEADRLNEQNDAEFRRLLDAAKRKGER